MTNLIFGIGSVIGHNPNQVPPVLVSFLPSHPFFPAHFSKSSSRNTILVVPAPTQAISKSSHDFQNKPQVPQALFGLTLRHRFPHLTIRLVFLVLPLCKSPPFLSSPWQLMICSLTDGCYLFQNVTYLKSSRMWSLGLAFSFSVLLSEFIHVVTRSVVRPC